MKGQKKNTSTFVVAEASANHNQNFKTAVSMIKKAKECGADAIKFQAYTPDSLTADFKNRHFIVRHPKWGDQTLYRLYEKAYTPLDWFGRLKEVADSEGILFFATAYDKTGVDLLEELDVPLHKVSSFELVDLPLIEYVAGTGKPVMLSTGMASPGEIREAVGAAKAGGAGDITLLKCVSSYPADPKDMNLVTIPDMKKSFNCRIGLSDHTLGTAVSIVAVSLGAVVIEKHFTLSRNARGPDSFFSIDPAELKRLVSEVRIAEDALGKVYYGLSGEEKKMRVFRRSLFSVKDIKKGEALTEENIRSIRPAHGLHPKYLKSVLGKKAKRKISKGSPLKKELIKCN